MSHVDTLSGPDLAVGVLPSEIPDDGLLLGHVNHKDAVLLVRAGTELFAIHPYCSHYHGPLAEGLVVGDTVRCPWHHACFSLRTGAVLAAPALTPLPCWRVEQVDGKIYVREKLPGPSKHRQTRIKNSPESVLIIGGGAAGESAATTLRQEGYEGPVTVLSAEPNRPCDRPNLSKDYLAGTAPEDWLWLRPEAFYTEHDITLHLNTRATAIDTARNIVRTEQGEDFSYAALLLATGAEPVKLSIPGAERPAVHYLRTPADSRAIIAAVQKGARRAVVIGASFIGLEVAASLRAREMEVHVVGPESRPLERVFGARLGDFVRTLHESKGVVFHLGRSVSAIQEHGVVLDDGATLPADIIIAGIGVRPALALAEQAGLNIDRGVLVDNYLETSMRGIYAAGDIARFPDRLSNAPIRVEHWVVAQRQGQTAARNMLGYRASYSAVPFFWSQHYDISLSYVGHAEQWDKIELEGDPEQHDCAARYLHDGRVLALASIFRDRESLRTEVRMEEQAQQRMLQQPN